MPADPRQPHSFTPLPVGRRFLVTSSDAPEPAPEP